MSDKVIQNNSESQSKKLSDAIQLANETLDIGSNILVELQHQKQKMQKIIKNVNDVNDELNKSNKLLKKMSVKWFNPFTWI
jgi:hypothetical protein